MSSEHVKILPVKPVIQHVASGSQRAFSFPFALFSAQDIEVLINDTKQSGNYTVSGLRVSTGGTVTFTTAPASGATVTLRRRLVLQRTSDFMPYDKFRASVINDELDYLAAGLQQLAADIDGCVRVAAAEVGTPAALDLPPKAARANKWLGFDAAGEVIAGQPQSQQSNQASWGAITGSLSAQTDLQAALNQKASTTHTHTGVYAPSTHNHDASYVPIIASPASGKFPTMTAAGALQTSTYGPSSFAGASHTHTASQLTLGGSLVDASGTLQLAADAATPGSSRYYGTDGSGVKGFFPLPAGGTITVKDEGSPVATNVSALNFTGGAVSASASGGEVTVNVAAAGATNAFGTVKVGSTNVEADAVSDTLTLSAGAGMGITANATSDTVTFSVSFAGTGSAANVARSDHNHDTAYAAVGHTHTADQLSLGGSLANASGVLQLAGDATAPGVSRYYGTDGSGAKGFFALPSGSGGGSPGGSDTQIQFNAAGAFAGSASLTYATTLKLLKTPLLGGKIFDAGTVSGTWSPPLAQGASVVLAAAAGNFTLATPSGVSLPNDHEVYLHLVVSNTAASPIYVTFDVGDNAGQYKVLHKRPLNTILPGASIELFVRWLGTRWFLVGPQPSPYPITFQVSGVPDASSVLFGMYIHNFGQEGALYVPYKLDDVGNVTCGTAPTASTAFSIERSASGQQPWAQIGTVTFSANQKDWSTWNFPNGITRFDHGDRLRIVAPANLNGLADLTFIMECLS